jgi:hypothetical protein
MRKQRAAKIPVLIYCEGKHDAAFVRYIRGVYAPSNDHNSFDVKPGVGGGALSVVRNARRVEGDYALRIAKFDNDRGDEELCTALNECQGSVLPCICTPCIEATMLEVIEGKSYAGVSTAACKRQFHTHIPEDRRLNIEQYAHLFPKELLETARRKVGALDVIIRIFEEGEAWKPVRTPAE